MDSNQPIETGESNGLVSSELSFLDVTTPLTDFPSGGFLLHELFGVDGERADELVEEVRQASGEDIFKSIPLVGKIAKTPNEVAFFFAWIGASLG